jgi:hypothetical protein
LGARQLLCNRDSRFPVRYFTLFPIDRSLRLISVPDGDRSCEFYKLAERAARTTKTASAYTPFPPSAPSALPSSIDNHQSSIPPEEVQIESLRGGVFLPADEGVLENFPIFEALSLPLSPSVLSFCQIDMAFETAG